MSYFVDGKYEAMYLPLRQVLYLPCGGVAKFDEASGISYRCELCGAVVGSIGQPQSCKDEIAKYENWKKLGGKGWNYSKGVPHE